MTVQDIDKGWKKLKRELKLMDNSYVVIGFPAGKVAPLDLKKAIWNEWGTKRKKGKKKKEHTPSRPFMRYSFKKYLDKIFSIKEKVYNDLKKGTGSVNKGLIKIGMVYSGLVKLSIRTGPWKENAPSTLKGKKSSKPLINEREMLKAVTYKVFIKRF
jgi:hypothetical protein